MNMNLMNLSKIPSDLFPLIQSFICRPDWRTCRKHEADCIAEVNRWVNRVLDDDALDWFYPGIKKTFPIIFSQQALDTYFTWTLFGRWFLIQVTKQDEYWFETKVHLKQEYWFDPLKQDHRQWYLQEFHSIQNSWRRIYAH